MLSSFIRKIGSRQTNAVEETANGADRRQYARSKVRTEVVVAVHGQRVPGYIQDVSISGALLTVPLSLQIGDGLSLEIERLSMPIAATVVRLTGEDFGLAFDDPGIGVLFAGWSRGSEIADGTDGSN